MMRNLRGTTNCGLRWLYELPVHLQRLPRAQTIFILIYCLALGVSLDHILYVGDRRSGSDVCRLEPSLSLVPRYARLRYILMCGPFLLLDLSSRPDGPDVSV
jgi:hypothetical protein